MGNRPRGSVSCLVDAEMIIRAAGAADQLIAFAALTAPLVLWYRFRTPSMTRVLSHEPATVLTSGVSSRPVGVFGPGAYASWWWYYTNHEEALLG